MSQLTAKYAENLLSGKECSNCSNEVFCNKRNKKLYGTCLKWKEFNGFESILRVVRLAYPNTIKGQILSEFPMKKNRDSVFYIKPEYKDDNTKNS